MGTLGVSGVKQIISALEHWRLNNQHKYPEVPAAQIGLRHDLRIKTFESAAAHKEPLRVKMAHTLKAKGTNAGLWLIFPLFNQFIKPRQIHSPLPILSSVLAGA
jgi:hypothetical protein